MKITIVLILAALTATTTSQASNRCMWLEALKRNNLDDTTVANLMCIAHHTTNFNKDAKRLNDHFGVFQVSAHKWCHCPKYKGPNLCRMDCSAFRDNNPNDDIQCALQVIKQQGYSAWGPWREHCAKRDLREYLTCESSC